MCPFYLTRMNLAYLTIILACSLIEGPLSVTSNAQLYLSPTQHDNSGIYSIVLKRSAPPSSRDFLIRSIGHISRDDEFKLISKSHQVHLGFTARLSTNLLQNVLKSKLVDYIQEDHPLKSGESELNEYCYSRIPPQNCPQTTTLWNLDTLGGNYQEDGCIDRPYGLMGGSVSVYVMDTGVMYEHEQFEGRAKYPGFDIIDQYFDENLKGADTHGHGTGVSGVVGGKDVGVAPGVTIFSVRVLKPDISGSWGMFVDGVEQILSHRESQKVKSPCVVSASLFSEMHHSSSGWRYTLINTLRKLNRAGCTFVTIAGNDGKSACGYLPANLSSPIVVGGSTPALTVQQISNHGPCVDVFAPGKDIKTASYACSSCLQKMTGTSFAAPHAAGVAALLLGQCPTLSHKDIKSKLIRFSLKDKLVIGVNQSPLDTPNRLLHMPTLFCECRQRD